MAALGALWQYQLALLVMHQLIDDKCKLMLQLLREFTSCALLGGRFCMPGLASVLQTASTFPERAGALEAACGLPRTT